ncbi:MAG: hypothetical protein AAFR11_15705, partial [Pseudomonadota bacterium]
LRMGVLSSLVVLAADRLVAWSAGLGRLATFLLSPISSAMRRQNRPAFVQPPHWLQKCAFVKICECANLAIS